MQLKFNNWFIYFGSNSDNSIVNSYVKLFINDTLNIIGLQVEYYISFLCISPSRRHFERVDINCGDKYINDCNSTTRSAGNYRYFRYTINIINFRIALLCLLTFITLRENLQHAHFDGKMSNCRADNSCPLLTKTLCKLFTILLPLV